MSVSCYEKVKRVFLQACMQLPLVERIRVIKAEIRNEDIAITAPRGRQARI